MGTKSLFSVRLFAVVILGSNLCLASSVLEELDGCFDKHFMEPACPNYDATLQCLNKVTPDGEFDTEMKLRNIKYVMEEKNKSCSALINKGTCYRTEYTKCAPKFIDLRAYNDPEVCNEVSNTLKCAQDIEAACPGSQILMSLAPAEVKETITACNEGFYSGKCAPSNVHDCVEAAWNDAPGGQVVDYVATCRRASVTSAVNCLKQLKGACSPKQLEYYQQKYDELMGCRIL